MYFHNPGVKQEVIKTKEVTAVHILTQIVRNCPFGACRFNLRLLFCGQSADVIILCYNKLQHFHRYKV